MCRCYFRLWKSHVLSCLCFCAPSWPATLAERPLHATYADTESQSSSAQLIIPFSVVRRASSPKLEELHAVLNQIRTPAWCCLTNCKLVLTLYSLPVVVSCRADL